MVSLNSKCSPCDLNNALKYAKRSAELLERLQKALASGDLDLAVTESNNQPASVGQGAAAPVLHKQPFMPQQPAPTIWTPIPYHGTRLAIMTSLSDFHPSYSLTSVIFDQVRAAHMGGFDVHLVIMENARDNQLPADLLDLEHLTIHGGRSHGADKACGIPVVHWKDDEIDQEKTNTLLKWLITFIGRINPDMIITHDLLFQAAHLTMARAIHMLGSIENLQWFHQAHSCCGNRPTGDVALWRASVPTGHLLLSENWAEIPYMCRYYQVDGDRVVTVANIRDCRDFFDLSKPLVDFVSKHQIHRADVCQVYPISTPRAGAGGKEVSKILDVFGALKAKGQTVRVVLANAHANGEEPERTMRELQAHARAVGLVNGEEVLWTSQEIPGTLVYGLSKADIRGLFHLSNVFLFPSYSEACGLIMLEAALSGNLLFLNADVPALGDFFPHGTAEYVSWGGNRNPHGIHASALAAEVADRVLGELAKNKICVSKRRLLQQFSLESMATSLHGLIGSRAPAL